MATLKSSYEDFSTVTVTYSTSATNADLTAKITRVQIFGQGSFGYTISSSNSLTYGASSGHYAKGSDWASNPYGEYDLTKNITKAVAKGTTAKTVYICLYITGYAQDWETALSSKKPVAYAAITVPALVSYAVKYAANGGSSTPSAQTKYHGQALALRGSISHAATTPASYKVTYNYNGSGQASGSATANVTRTWTFSKWKASDGKTYAAGGSYTANAATTMTAQWTTSDSTAQLTLPTPNARTGYTFAGWYTAATGGSSKGAAGAKFTPTAATTLYAHWTGNSYAVNYNANGGTGAPSAQTRTYGTALTLSTTKPTRIGHTFLGWATTSSAKAAQYAPGASYNPSTAAATTLYAVWKSNYAAPKISSLTAVRCDSTGAPDDEGGYAKVTAAWSTMQSIDQNKTANYGTVTGKTRASNSSSDVDFTFSSGAGGTGVYSGTAVAIVPNMSTERSYRVMVTVADAQGGSSTSRSTVLSASFFTMDFAEGGRGVGILEAAPETGVAVGDDVTLHGDLNMEGDATRSAEAQMTGAAPSIDQRVDQSYRLGARPAGPVWNGGVFAHDSNGDQIFYTQPSILADGRTQRSFVAARRSDDGADSYTNGFYLGLNPDGTPYTSFTSGGAAAWRAGMNVVNKSGDTMSGTLTNDGASFVAKYHANVDGVAQYDRDGAAPTADRWSTGLYINDTDGETTTFLRSARRGTSGRMDAVLWVYNEPEGGSAEPVGNGLIIGVDRDGTKYYYVSDKPKFRADMETLGAVTKNGYGGMMHPSGNDTAYMRTTQSGLIPYQSGGASVIGTSTWPFSSGYFNALTVDGVSVRNAGIINAGTLPLARGGTGASLSAAPSIIVDLASTSGASPFAASPKPGVTGILPQAHGGTGLGTAYANITSYDLGSTPIKTSTWTECRYPASGTSAPARVKPGAGVYIVFLSFAFAANANGGRLITAGTTSNVTGYSDSNYLAARLHASNSGTTKSTTATVTEFGADDTLYVRAWQDSGATINCAVHVRLVRIA